MHKKFDEVQLHGFRVMQADRRQTNRHTHHNTSHSSWDKVTDYNLRYLNIKDKLQSASLLQQLTDTKTYKRKLKTFLFNRPITRPYDFIDRPSLQMYTVCFYYLFSIFYILMFFFYQYVIYWSMLLL